MGDTTIMATYSLDIETVRALDGMAKRWRVSKSEALRRAIRMASPAAGPERGDPSVLSIACRNR